MLCVLFVVQFSVSFPFFVVVVCFFCVCLCVCVWSFSFAIISLRKREERAGLTLIYVAGFVLCRDYFLTVPGFGMWYVIVIRFSPWATKGLLPPGGIS